MSPAPLSRARLSWLCHQLNADATLAYPTEAVYGLGCRADKLDAVEAILDIKQRPWQKGVLLVGSHLAQFSPWIKPLSSAEQSKITDHFLSVINGEAQPTTWIVPAAKHTSPLLRGQHESIGVRLCAHPLVRQVCDATGLPLVSTSANRAGKKPLRNTRVLMREYRRTIDVILTQPTLGYRRPSQIRSLDGNQLYRP